VWCYVNCVTDKRLDTIRYLYCLSFRLLIYFYKGVYIYIHILFNYLITRLSKFIIQGSKTHLWSKLFNINEWLHYTMGIFIDTELKLIIKNSWIVIWFQNEKQRSRQITIYPRDRLAPTHRIVN